MNARGARNLNTSPGFLVTITTHVALLARGGATARRLMKLVWSVIIGLTMVDMVWLAMTDLQLAPSSWIAIVRGISFSLFAALLCELISQPNFSRCHRHEPEALRHAWRTALSAARSTRAAADIEQCKGAM